MGFINWLIERRYWAAYYLVYVVSIGICVWYFWAQLLGEASQLDDAGQYQSRFYLLAAIFAVSAGAALLASIIVEVIGTMVLLIPATWRKAKNQGRKEERERVKGLIAEHGQQDPDTGTVTVTLTPELREQLFNGSGEGS